MSQRIDIGPGGFIYPMPMTLVGADLTSGPNFMTIAWINRVEMNPPLVAAGLNKRHATNEGIREHGEFSVNIPGVNMVAVTDWCGMESAARGADKAAAFEVTRGTLAHAPMIAECPLSLECKVVQIVDIGTHELFIGEVVATWTEERYLDERGRPDITAIKPFTLTMPDNRYWAVGEHVGNAWSIGREYGAPGGGAGR